MKSEDAFLYIGYIFRYRLLNEFFNKRHYSGPDAATDLTTVFGNEGAENQSGHCHELHQDVDSGAACVL